jgi:ABC-type nickel/cobalt efflux system permease component RcnA
MKRLLPIMIVLMLLLLPWIGSAGAGNPFTSKPGARHVTPEPPIQSPFVMKIVIWQHRLQQTLSDLIRDFKSDERFGPLMVLIGLAFAYGAIHAAGPGHGKVVAMSYVLSHRPSIPGGVAFALCIAMIHGVSGIVGVIGLRYVIQRSVSQTLASVTEITQMVSFGLIAILGMGILVKHSAALFFRKKSPPEKKPEAIAGKNVWPWAIAVGVVPCPAVVMVMLFCMSMDGLLLGLLLALCISLGMGTTISLVVTTAILGKTGMLRAVSGKRLETVEAAVGMLSGAAIAVFGALLCIPAIHRVLY